MKLFRPLIASACLCFATLGVQAADATNHPGYLDFSAIERVIGQEANVEVNLSGPVLKMLTNLPIQYDQYGEEGEMARELLRVIEQVTVRIYEGAPAMSSSTINLITETADRLEREQWVRIVRVREDTDNVDIHVKVSEDGENLSGLVVLAVDSSGDNSELVFVNIAGNFNPAYIANLGNQFDIDYLEDVDVNLD